MNWVAMIHLYLPGIASSSLVPAQSLCSSFGGQTLRLNGSRWAPLRGASHMAGAIKMMAKPAIQFIQGTDERTIPDVRLTKSRDGTNGMAIFTFEQPSVFDSSSEFDNITGFYMIDEEG
ncbi:hypothetical protein Scep_019989 [Stephania cephalantha]|uniref:Photosystem II reaction center Psb28 protein n=1 Tax=Stephania cephalantha TaxID=152367 RepID=A0AAP0IC85_9MAGN